MCGFVTEPENALELYTTLQFIDMLGLSIADTVMDGLLIELTPPEDESKIQGTISMCLAGGIVLGMICFSPMQQAGKTNPSYFQAYFFSAAMLFTFFMFAALPYGEEPDVTKKNQPDPEDQPDGQIEAGGQIANDDGNKRKKKELQQNGPSE